MFELCIAQRMYKYFKHDELQYDFVNRHGCQKALLTLQTVVNCFTSCGSPIYLASLDASKAFCGNHYDLLGRLISLGIPLYLLKIVINLHLKLKRQVRWNGALSDVFLIKSDMRQGGFNSTWFF